MLKRKRTSVYLDTRCEIMQQLLEFFEAQGLDPLLKVERAVVFLTQLKFWDWELENLIFAITSYQDRSSAWTDINGYGMANALRSDGFWIRKRYLGGLKNRRVFQQKRGVEVVEPLNRLNGIITRWNRYLDFLEVDVLIDAEERLELAGHHCAIHVNMDAWRKQTVGMA